MTVVETRVSVWEALAGRAPGQPTGPADPGLWSAVAERLNPARAKPRLREGIEDAHLVSVRDVPYVMLRSPDGAGARYLRLAPAELALARLMDGTRTVARLVAEFARICGRLAPDQVTRVVADLAANRMLEELPLDAFRPLARTRRRPWPIRLGRGILAAVRGRRVVLASVDPLVGFLYRCGGRLLFTRPAAVLCGVVALAGLGLFGWNWSRGDQSTFMIKDSYALGALALLGLNVLALACHELGHALGAKHAGRRVPAAGFLVYFGIPSVFVDTTDVWMAGRRARLLTTAAGPATGLVLAGAAQLVGLAFPPLAPLTFKLSFAWYLNALFNLNPFLALDGYYLLMDWLEVPNLRARGMAWVIARLRRRPPRFGELDREGRLVALYGMLAVVWLVIAFNLAYRVYLDRVRGLITGLWRAGWPARLLLAAVVVGLAAPVVYLMSGWLGRRWRRLRQRFAERRLASDAPRRQRALQASPLGGLPPERLAGLAARSRWVHPRTGEQLVFAGAAQADVYVVVDGALEARRPGDPTGTVRERVGPGGVVGLAAALTGAPAALSWHTAGTTLLAVPCPAIAEKVGPLPGPPPLERAELDTLFGEAPALALLSADDFLTLASRARAAALPPGAPVVLADAGEAAVVAAGVVRLPDGSELRRGDLIGPGIAGEVGTTRTPARVWTLSALGGRTLVLDRAPAAVAGVAGGAAPGFGAHPVTAYPPLAAPPGPPPEGVDESTDRRFERRLWWLLLLLLLFALLVSGANLLPGPAWAEMPSDRALLQVDRGRITATVAGTRVTLSPGEQVYLREADEVAVGARAAGRLTFRGGAASVLCAGSTIGVGRLVSEQTQPIQPTGALILTSGRLLADTASTSAAFHPLRLTVASDGASAANDGEARFMVAGGAVDAAAGTVTRDGTPLPTSGHEFTCGDDTALPGTGGSPPPSPPPSPSPSVPPSPSPSASPSVSPTPSASPSPAPGRTTAAPTRGPTPGPTRTTAAPPPPPPPNNAPTIGWFSGDPGGGSLDQVWAQRACNGGVTVIGYLVVVTDDHDPGAALDVELTWAGTYFSGSKRMTLRGTKEFSAQLGPFDYGTTNGRSDTFAITVTATDTGRATRTLVANRVNLLPCNIIG